MARHIRIGQGARKRNRRWVTVGVTVAVAVTALALAMCLWCPKVPASNRYAKPNGPAGDSLTHTQFSADDGEPTAVATAEGAIKSVPIAQAQTIMGWGVDNPEPSPGQYDFRSLDRRMEFIRRSGGIPVIRLVLRPGLDEGRRGRADRLGPLGRYAAPRTLR
jgi:hypothetical protein